MMASVSLESSVMSLTESFRYLHSGTWGMSLDAILADFKDLLHSRVLVDSNSIDFSDSFDKRKFSDCKSVGEFHMLGRSLKLQSDDSLVKMFIQFRGECCRASWSTLDGHCMNFYVGESKRDMVAVYRHFTADSHIKAEDDSANSLLKDMAGVFGIVEVVL